MEYGRLYTILLGVSGSEKKDTTNQRIAQYLLQNLRNPDAVSIKNISTECYVGKASISRFCRDIGLEDFFELKELIAGVQFQADIHHTELFYHRLQEYREPVREALDMIVESVKEQDIYDLCVDIHKYKKVAAFGWLKSEAAALVLQSELSAAGKNVRTLVSYKEQQEYLKAATEEDLILIFSYRGIYFQYHNMPDISRYLMAPKVYFLTGSREAFPEGVDRVIRFHSDFAQNKHPYQLLFLSSVISREYARIYGLPE